MFEPYLFYSTMSSTNVTCPCCKKTLKCKYPSTFQQHLIYCKGLKNKCNQSPINNNNICNDDMSITSDSNNSVESLNTNTVPSSENDNDDYPPDIEVASVIDDDMFLYDDIMETSCHQNNQECFLKEVSEDDISLESIDALELVEEVIDYSTSKPSDSKCESSLLLHPFEAKLLQLFVNNSIPITLFPLFTSLFQYGQDTEYNPKKAPSYHQLITKLKTIKELKRHQYVTKQYIVDNTFHSIRVFPFLDNVKWLLSQEELMSNGLFSYDSKSNSYFEMNTGSWWKKAEKDMLYRTTYVSEFNGSKHVLVPIILFIDKTHCSNNGSLNAEPVLVSIGKIPLECRKKTKSWFNLGFLPQKTDRKSVV